MYENVADVALKESNTEVAITAFEQAALCACYLKRNSSAVELLDKVRILFLLRLCCCCCPIVSPHFKFFFTSHCPLFANCYVLEVDRASPPNRLRHSERTAEEMQAFRFEF